MKPGDVFAISLPSGRFGAARVVAVEMGTITFVVLDGFWDRPPTEAEVAVTDIMPKPYGQGPGLDEDLFKGWLGQPPDDGFPRVASLGARPNDAAFATVQGTMVFQSPAHLADTLHGQWRWLHERTALEAEWRAGAACLERAARDREAGLSFESMLRERPFGDWQARWGREVVRDVRRIFRDTTRELIERSAASDVEACRRVLCGIVDDLNALYDHTGCIETGEGEALVARIEELARLVGTDNDNESLTGHRDW